MNTVTNIICDITDARSRREAALDAWEEADRAGGDADARQKAELDLAATGAAERHAFVALGETPAVDAREAVAKAMILVGAVTGENLGEPTWEAQLPALHASIERDCKDLGVRV